MLAQRDADLDEHLGVADGGLVRAAVELGHVDHALAAAAADDGDARRARRRRRCRSSDGSAWQSAPPIVPRLRTGGSAISSSASREDREVAGEQLGLEHLAVARERADAHLAVLLADVAELGLERVDVDQVLRRREPQLHHRQQRVAAGDEPRLRARAAPAARSPRRRSTRARSRTAQVPAWPPSPQVDLRADATPARSGRSHAADNRSLIVGVRGDVRPAPLVRHGRPPGLGERGRAGARRERAGGLGGGRRAAARPRRRAVRPRRRRHPADARRRAAGRGGGGDHRARGPAAARGRARRAASAGCCGSRSRRRWPSTSRRRCSTRSRAAGRRSRSRRRSPRRRTSRALLADRRADVALGPGARAGRRASRRCRSCATSSSSSPAPRHRLAGARDVAAAALRGERWLVGPAGAGPRAASSPSAALAAPERGRVRDRGRRAGRGRPRARA